MAWKHEKEMNVEAEPTSENGGKWAVLIGLYL